MSIKKIVGAGIVAYAALTGAASADNGFSPANLLPRNQWVNTQIYSCYVAGWGGWRDLIVLFPIAGDSSKFLWTTDEASVGFLASHCAIGGTMTVSTFDGKTWLYQLGHGHSID